MPTTQEILQAINSAKEGQGVKKPFVPVQPKKVGLGEVAKELPTGVVSTFLKTPAQFLSSAAEVPKTLMTGKASQKEYNLYPGVSYKSFQSEAETTAGEVVEGKKPLGATLVPMAKTVLAGAEILGIGKTFAPDVYLTSAPEIALRVSEKIIPGGKIVFEAGGKAGQVTSPLIVQIAQDFYKSITTPRAKVEKPIKGGEKMAEETYKPVTKSEKTEAMARAGKQGGVKEQGKLKEWAYEPTKDEIASAKTAIKEAKLGTKDNTLIKLDKINKTITKISEDRITPSLEGIPSQRFSRLPGEIHGTNPETEPGMMEMLDDMRQMKGQEAVNDFLKEFGWKENTNIFSIDELTNRIDAIQPKGTSKYNKDLTAQFNGMKETAKKVINITKPDSALSGWKNRKVLDGVIQDEFGDAIYNWESPYNAVAKDANLKIRHVYNDYISEVAGDTAGSQFKQDMKNLTTLYDVRDNLSLRNYKLLNSNVFLRFALSHPKLLKTAGALGGAGAIGYFISLLSNK